MSWLDLLLVALGLSMDAFAVSVCKGLSVKKATWRQMLCCGLWFGGFQALMPLLGWLLGSGVSTLIEKVDHWIAFGLLAFIGIRMVMEARSDEAEGMDPDFSAGIMLKLAIATSIDALAAGISFAAVGVSILPAVLFIGLVTLALSALGVYLGGIFGSRLGRGAELAGGVILILIGVKILAEHMGWLV